MEGKEMTNEERFWVYVQWLINEKQFAFEVAFARAELELGAI